MLICMMKENHPIEQEKLVEKLTKCRRKSMKLGSQEHET